LYAALPRPKAAFASSRRAASPAAGAAGDAPAIGAGAIAAATLAAASVRIRTRSPRRIGAGL
jgi:hypothetical protein